MSDTLTLIRDLARQNEAVVSRHGARELDNDAIHPFEVLSGLAEAVVVEDYPLHERGPCVLVLQRDSNGDPIHAVWGIPKGRRGPAVLVTAYRPDPRKWSPDFRKRVPQ